MKKRKITACILSDFKRSLMQSEKSDLTTAKYLRDVNHFMKFSEGKTIDKEAVIEYKTSLANAFAIASANSMIASLNAFFRFAGWKDLCIRQFKVQKQTFSKAEKELSKAEYMRLVSAAKHKQNTRLCLILQTICGTGIRVSELQFITAEAVRKGRAVVSSKSKTRTVFIVRKLQSKLFRYMKEKNIVSGQIFLTKNGKPISRMNIWRQMKSLCGDAEVSSKKVFPHNLRHLFARTFYAIEKDIAKLADILGHSSIETTRIYIATTGIEHRRKMENMRLII